MRFLHRFLSGYRLPFARFDQENNEPGVDQRGCLSTLLSNPRILIALAMVVIGIYKFFLGGTEYHNDFTGRNQRLAMPSPAQETKMGLASAPEMIRQFGGEVSDPTAAGMVSRVGQRIVSTTAVQKTEYKFQFHLLRDDRTINAFALPGGQVFITNALFKLLKTEGQLAGVLGHEIGHVVARHSNEQMQSSDAMKLITQGLGIGFSNGHDGGSMQMAQYVGNLVNMKFSRNDELEADAQGVHFLIDCGYNPEEMIGVMEILKANAGDGHQSQMLSTHPDPGNRIEHIRAEIAKYKGGQP